MSTNLNMASVNKVKELVDKRDFKTALAELKKIDVDKSLNPQFMRLCGQVYAENKKFDDARKTLISAHILAPRSSEIIDEIIRLYLKMGYFTKAKQYYKIYTACAPKEGIESQTVLYNVKKALQAPDSELIEILEGICEKQYVDEWAFELALLYRKAGMNDKSVKECEKIMKSFSQSCIYVKWAKPLKMGSINVNKAFNCYPKDEVPESTGTIYQSVQEENEQLRKDYADLFGSADLNSNDDAVIVEEVDDDDAISVAAQITDTVKSTVSSAFGKVKDTIVRPLDEEVEVEIVEGGVVEEGQSILDSGQSEDLLHDGDNVQDNDGNPFLLEEDTVAARQQEEEEATGEINDLQAALQRVAKKESREEDAAPTDEKDEDEEELAAAAQALAEKLNLNKTEKEPEIHRSEDDAQDADSESVADTLAEEEDDAFDMQAMLLKAAQSVEEDSGSEDTTEEEEDSISFMDLESSEEGIEILDLGLDEEDALSDSSETELTVPDSGEPEQDSSVTTGSEVVTELQDAAEQKEEDKRDSNSEDDKEEINSESEHTEKVQPITSEDAEAKDFQKNDFDKEEAFDMADGENKPKLSLKIAGGGAGGGMNGGANRSSFAGSGINSMRMGGQIISKEEREFMAKYDAKQAEREAAAKERARLAKEAEKAARIEAEKAAKEEAERKRREAEEARIAHEKAVKEAEERKKREEEEARIAAEKAAKEAQERAIREAQEQAAKEAEEKKLAEERAEREAREAAERAAREAEEAKRREEARIAEEQAIKKAEEERIAQKQAEEAKREEEKMRIEQERIAREKAEAAAKAKVRNKYDQEREDAIAAIRAKVEAERAAKAEKQRKQQEMLDNQERRRIKSMPDWKRKQVPKETLERLGIFIDEKGAIIDKPQEKDASTVEEKEEIHAGREDAQNIEIQPGRQDEGMSIQQEQAEVTLQNNGLTGDSLKDAGLTGPKLSEVDKNEVTLENAAFAGDSLVHEESAAPVMGEDSVTSQEDAEETVDAFGEAEDTEPETVDAFAEVEDTATKTVDSLEESTAAENSVEEAVSDSGAADDFAVTDDATKEVAPEEVASDENVDEPITQDEELEQQEQNTAFVMVDTPLETDDTDDLEETILGEMVPEEENEEPQAAVEKPKVEEPQTAVEEPKVEEPQTAVEEPKVEEPQTAVEEPKVEEPQAAVEEPKVEEPQAAVEELKVEEPQAAVEEPKVEESQAAVEELKVEESQTAVEELKVEESQTAVEELKVEESQTVEEEQEQAVETTENTVIYMPAPEKEEVEDSSDKDVTEEVVTEENAVSEDKASGDGVIYMPAPEKEEETPAAVEEEVKPETLQATEEAKVEELQSEEVKAQELPEQEEKTQEPSTEEPQTSQLVSEETLTAQVKEEKPDEEEIQFNEKGIPVVAEKYIGKYVASSAVCKQFRKPLENIIKKRGSYRNIVVLSRKGCSVSNVAINFARTYHELGLCKNKVVATIKARMLNKTDIQKILPKLIGGCLIIENAGELSHEKALEVFEMINNPENDIVLMLVGEVLSVTKMFSKNSELNSLFHALFLLHDLSNLDLADIALAYVKENGYEMDVDAVRAMKERIASMEHNGIDNVLSMVDEAIANAEKRSKNNLTDVVFLDAYEDSGLNVLKEFDFE